MDYIDELYLFIVYVPDGTASGVVEVSLVGFNLWYKALGSWELTSNNV